MSNPTNEDRAARIDPTIEFYAVECKGDACPDENDIPDLLTDIMHYCREEGLLFDTLLATARMNFEAEVSYES